MKTLRICTAYKTCPIDNCRHKVPHECDDSGMHRASTCYDAMLLSSCTVVTNGTIKVTKNETCDCCGSTKRVIGTEKIS